jgi:hypothetical protein
MISPLGRCSSDCSGGHGRGGLSQLLGHPGITRASGHPEMHQPTRIQLGYNQNKDGAEEEVIGLQEVAGPYVLGMVAQKRRPGLLGRQRSMYLVMYFWMVRLTTLMSSLSSSPRIRVRRAAILRHVLDQCHVALSQVAGHPSPRALTCAPKSVGRVPDGSTAAYQVGRSSGPFSSSAACWL